MPRKKKETALTTTESQPDTSDVPPRTKEWSPKALRAILNLLKDRPILIDERDGACQLCASHKKGLCDSCGKKIDSHDPNMAGNGYQSVRPTHLHIASLPQDGGPPFMARQSKFAELCYKCHRQDRLNVYGESYGEAV